MKKEINHRVEETQKLQEILEINKSILEEIDLLIKVFQKHKGIGKFWLYMDDYVFIVSDKDITIKKKFKKEKIKVQGNKNCDIK